MNDCSFYFKLGWEHIIGWGALDHLLFIAALTACYTATQWKKVLVLVTAFTIGHSITLLLSTYDLLRFNSKWVEFLIPLSICITAMMNFGNRENSKPMLTASYLTALFFGLIHGMGFANSIRFMLASSQNIGWPLFGFNVGLEAGQLMVVVLLILIAYLVNKTGFKRPWWVNGVSGIALLIAAWMCIERWPF